MKLRIVIMALLSTHNSYAEITEADHQPGQICHADPEESKFNYPGLWEIDSTGKMVCNYKQFISEEDWINSLRVHTDNSVPEEIDNEFNIYIDERYEQ